MEQTITLLLTSKVALLLTRAFTIGPDGIMRPINLEGSLRSWTGTVVIRPNDKIGLNFLTYPASRQHTAVQRLGIQVSNARGVESKKVRINPKADIIKVILSEFESTGAFVVETNQPDAPTQSGGLKNSPQSNALPTPDGSSDDRQSLPAAAKDAEPWQPDLFRNKFSKLGPLEEYIQEDLEHADRNRIYLVPSALKAPLPAPAAPAHSTTYFPVWYATNRQGSYDSTGHLTGFTANFSENAATSYGNCWVDIPKGHVIGQTRSNAWRRLLRTLTFRKDDQEVRLMKLDPQQQQDYWTSIQEAAAKWAADERCGVVFIHGYNVSFEEAAIRAAQIGYDLQVRGPMSFFSWPSQGTLLGYSADEAAIEASEDAISKYLLDFARNSGAERIHVIAHSMGNRGLLRALQRILSSAAADSPKLFEHFILAAPDVDQKLFLNLADCYSRAARRTTLYVSNKDKALASSKMLRAGMARAGLAPPITIAPNIDTVQVDNIDMTLLGHGYVAEARDVLNDMHQLLYQNALPGSRMGLRPAKAGSNTYWVIGA